MRASSLVLCGSIGIVGAALVMACAASGDDPETTSPDADSGVAVVTDGRSPGDGGNESEDADIGPATCSQAGWCVTALPDSDLLMKAIWSLENRAFAIAESPTLGVRILEWDNGAAGWSYIDDNTQNADGLGRFAGNIWAPGENELYYGVSPNYIYHGSRPAPGATWSWTRAKLGTSNSADPDDGNPTYWKANYTRVPALGVWGTSSSDVYAWFKGGLYHWTSADGGAPEWVLEYVAADADATTEQLFFLGAAGSTPGDVWFSAARSRSGAGCAILVRKNADGYRRVADGVVTGFGMPCQPRAGALLISGTEGWLTDLQSLGPDRLVGLKGGRDAVRISVEGDSYSAAVAPIPPTVSVKGLNSLSTVGDNLWLGGAGLIVQGTNVWDGGAYSLSTLSLNGAPLNRAIYQVRGTSNTNLWAIGVRYAFHKTTP
jgi:hypothetical protein